MNFGPDKRGPELGACGGIRERATYLLEISEDGVRSAKRWALHPKAGVSVTIYRVSILFICTVLYVQSTDDRTPVADPCNPWGHAQRPCDGFLRRQSK